MANNHRVERVAQQILREANDIMLKDVKDPRIDGVTLTDVDVTGDLQEATIYYSTLSDKASDREKVEKGLNKAKGLIQSKVGQRLHIYKTPELRFKRDPSIEYGSRIDALIAQLHKNDSQSLADSESEE
ncbi:MAG: 30S ribosome-binding factor RbfA [Aerococcus sp.]|nr:30S ribosome-binding factor RbfA [Aerococcus sp.]